MEKKTNDITTRYVHTNFEFRKRIHIRKRVLDNKFIISIETTMLALLGRCYCSRFDTCSAFLVMRTHYVFLRSLRLLLFQFFMIALRCMSLQLWIPPPYNCSSMFHFWKYGLIIFQSTPPKYNATRMEVPSMLYSGTADWLADPVDTVAMIPKLQNVVGMKNITGYEHLDFVWAMDVANLVYADMISRIKARDME